MTDDTMPSISVLTSFTLVCDSNRGLRQLDAQHADQTFAHVVAGDRGSFSFSRLFCLAYWLMARVRAERKPGQVRAAVGIGNRVGEAEDLVVVAVVVLHHAIDEHLILLPA